MGMPKKEGAWTFCRFKGGYLARKRELGFRGGVDTPMHSICFDFRWEILEQTRCVKLD